MPSFSNMLVGIGPICNAGCTAKFIDVDVTVYLAEGKPILTGWQETDMPKMWQFALCQDKHAVPATSDTTESIRQTVYSAYNLPSVAALVRHLHAAAGFPVKDTCLWAIKAGNYATWPGLTNNNAAK